MSREYHGRGDDISDTRYRSHGRNGGQQYRNNGESGGGNWNRHGRENFPKNNFRRSKHARSPEREAQFPHRDVHKRKEEKIDAVASGGTKSNDPFNRGTSSAQQQQQQQQQQQPLSVEELLQKKREKEIAETKPTFLTKKERERQKVKLSRKTRERMKTGGILVFEPPLLLLGDLGRYRDQTGHTNFARRLDLIGRVPPRRKRAI